MSKKSGPSFQAFLRDYVPRPASPVANPIPEETLCPACLDRFEAGTVPADYPYCPDCVGEGVEQAVVPLDQFMAGKSPQDFDAMLARCQSAQGLRPQYREVLAQRILALKALTGHEKAYMHFTVIADGVAGELEAGFDCPPGPAVMSMKAWASDADEALDMVRVIGRHVGFTVQGEVEVYETPPEQPPGDHPGGYDIRFVSYDDPA